jgi:thiol-disulfide isomerase/thioredoxin
MRAMQTLIVLVIITFLSVNVFSQKIELVNFETLNASVHKDNDTLYILNFWATWCKPCIEELPAFEKINEEFKDHPVSMTLVNLDFHSKVESSVKPFLLRKEIKSVVVHITDSDPNEWINRIDKRWSGAIPATVVIKNTKTIFFKEGSMSYEELREEMLNCLIKDK